MRPRLFGDPAMGVIKLRAVGQNAGAPQSVRQVIISGKDPDIHLPPFPALRLIEMKAQLLTIGLDDRVEISVDKWVGKHERPIAGHGGSDGQIGGLQIAHDVNRFADLRGALMAVAVIRERPAGLHNALKLCGRGVRFARDGSPDV